MPSDLTFAPWDVWSDEGVDEQDMTEKSFKDFSWGADAYMDKRGFRTPVDGS